MALGLVLLRGWPSPSAPKVGFSLPGVLAGAEHPSGALVAQNRSPADRLDVFEAVINLWARSRRSNPQHEANATATESTTKTSSTSKSLVPIDQHGDLQLGTAFTVSPLLTYAFMHASCLIKIQIERIVLDEIVANTVWW